MRALGDALADGRAPPSFSATVALARNVALFPVILVQGVRALVGRG